MVMVRGARRMETMKEVVLDAEKRDVIGKKVSRLRREGKLPAVLYGYNIESTPIVLDARDASKTLSELTTSSLVTIKLDGEDYSVLVRDRQRDFIRGDLLHVDFQVVSLTDKIRAEVTIEQEGVAPAVKEFSGVVVTEYYSVEVESLPRNLPEKFVVDLSTLENIGDAIYIRDLEIPENVDILHEPDEVVVLISTAVVEEEPEEEELPEEELLEEPELIERGRKEEEIEEQEEE